MMELILENLVNIAAALLLAILSVAGAWLSAALSRSEQLKSIHAAQQELLQQTRLTVGQLQQELVEGMKARSADGKLSGEEVAELKALLLQKTLAKLSAPAAGLLQAAGVDLAAFIASAAEDWILQRK